MGHAANIIAIRLCLGRKCAMKVMILTSHNDWFDAIVSVGSSDVCTPSNETEGQYWS